MRLTCEHMSVSRYETWRNCQAQYKHRYHLKTIVEEAEADYLTYGKLIHEIAEQYVNNGGYKTIQKIGKEILIGKHLPQKYKKRFAKDLSSLEKITNKFGFSGETEWDFKYDLIPPEGLYITGIIDRLIFIKKKIFILDYKTTQKKSSFRKNEGNISKDLQLNIYAKAVQREFGTHAKDIHAALFYLDGAELIETTFDQDRIDSAETQLANTLKEIKETNTDNIIAWHDYKCNYCPYKNVCEFYKPM